MVKQKPGTELPWIVNRKNEVINAGATAHVAKCHELARGINDAHYIAHACNAYPRLVEALREMSDVHGRAVESVGRRLLRELGEEG